MTLRGSNLRQNDQLDGAGVFAVICMRLVNTGWANTQEVEKQEEYEVGRVGRRKTLLWVSALGDEEMMDSFFLTLSSFLNSLFFLLSWFGQYFFSDFLLLFLKSSLASSLQFLILFWCPSYIICTQCTDHNYLLLPVSLTIPSSFSIKATYFYVLVQCLACGRYGLILKLT